MSRSRKKHPFQSVCATNRDDKPMASRGIRRTFRRALHVMDDPDEFLSPHRFECPHNNTYSWGRDGGQIYQGLTGRKSYFYGEGSILYDGWPPKWYLDMMRK